MAVHAALVHALVFALGGAILSAGTGCSDAHSGAPDASSAPVVRIPVTIATDTGPVTIQAELADTPAERSMGLMFRTSMQDDHGMLFLFPEEEPQSFWMKNTLIPLDMIFIRADHTILGIVENATPKTLTPRNVPGPSQFVLEVNGGVSAKRGFRAGQKVDFYAPLPSD
ncbi:DUF192 domain-containing protein [Myxococcota bacterium]|nr:DUF192 domain-containing protein [Myxococcota bacterium]